MPWKSKIADTQVATQSSLSKTWDTYAFQLETTFVQSAQRQDGSLKIGILKKWKCLFADQFLKRRKSQSRSKIFKKQWSPEIITLWTRLLRIAGNFRLKLRWCTKLKFFMRNLKESLTSELTLTRSYSMLMTIKLSKRACKFSMTKSAMLDSTMSI